MDKTSQNAQNVITMSDFQPEGGYAALAQVEAYWEALRGNRLMPSRSDIDPRGIEQALEFAFIVERIAPGIARLRIAGNHLSDLLGMEVRGMPLTALFGPDSRRKLSDTLEDVFETPAMAKIALKSDRALGRPALEGRMTLLPLKSDLGDVSRILGCIVVKGELGHTPRRMELASVNLQAVTAGTGAAPVVAKPKLPDAARPHLPAAAPVAPQPGFAAPAPAFDGRKRKPLPPYLRVVKSEADDDR